MNLEENRSKVFSNVTNFVDIYGGSKKIIDNQSLLI